MEKGIIYIESRDGMYFLQDNADKMEEFQDPLLVERGYSFVSLSDCYSIEDITSAILKKEMKTLIFCCEKETLVLIKTINEKLTQLLDNPHFIWIVKGINENFKYNLDGGTVDIFPNFFSLIHAEKNLNTVSTIAFKDLMDLIPSDDDIYQNKLYEETMNNGYCLMLTGKYPNSYIYSKAKHVYISDIKILDEIDLAECMDINSAIFIPFSQFDEKKYEEWKLKFFNRIHVIDKDKIILDRKKESVNWSMISYTDFYKRKSDHVKDALTPYLKLTSDQDFNCFKDNIVSFSTTGKISDFDFYLVDECRWANRCSLLYQKRFTLNGDGKVAICSDTDQTVYNIKDNEFEQFSIREKMIEQAQIKRKCRNCVANEWCTKCSQLSECLSESLFCEFIIQNPTLPEFINIKNILLMFKRYSSLGKSLDLHELEFSNYSHALLLPSTMQSKKPIDQNIYLFQYDQKYYYFNPIKGQVLRIGIYLAFIVEAIQKGYTYDEIQITYDKVWEEERPKQSFQCAWTDVKEKILT